MRHATEYDAIVLAGGRGRRLGGVDKAALDVGRGTLLDGVLTAAAGARRVIVVGPERSLPRGVVGTSESPPGGGPVAGLSAGLGLVTSPLVAVLACDLPFVTDATVRSLLDRLTSDHQQTYDGAQLVDEHGRGQPLTAVYRTTRLAAAVRTLVRVADTPMHVMLEQMTMLDVEAASGQAWDCDTWADVERARQRVDENLVEES